MFPEYRAPSVKISEVPESQQEESEPFDFEDTMGQKWRVEKVPIGDRGPNGNNPWSRIPQLMTYSDDAISCKNIIKSLRNGGVGVNIFSKVQQFCSQSCVWSCSRKRTIVGSKVVPPCADSGIELQKSRKIESKLISGLLCIVRPRRIVLCRNRQFQLTALLEQLIEKLRVQAIITL
jgi:hypothetical protein